MLRSLPSSTSGRRRSRGIALILPILLCCVAGADIASAQTADNSTVIESEAALAKMSDAEVRALLLSRLRQAEAKAVPETQFNPLKSAQNLERAIVSAQLRLQQLLSVRHRISDEFDEAWARISMPGKSDSLIRFFGATFFAFAIAWLLEYLLGRKMKPVREALLAAREGDSASLRLPARVSRLGGLMVFDITRVLVFSIGAAVVFFLVEGGEAAQRSAFFYYLSALIVLRLAWLLAAAFYAPGFPHMRVPAYSDKDASSIRLGLVGTMGLSAFGFFTCALLQTLEVRTDAHPLLLIMVGIIYVVFFSLTLFVHRQAITRDLKIESAPNSPRFLFASIWPWLVILGTVVIWLSVLLVSLGDRPPLYGAALLSSWMMLLYPSLDAALEREAFRALSNDEEILVPVMRVLRLVAAIAVIAIVASAWRVSLISSADGGIGSKLTAIALQVSMTLLVAYVLWQAARIWIDRKIAEEDAELTEQGIDLSEVIGGTGLSRTRTLLPLLRMTLKFGLGAIMVMLVLSVLGVDIAPVLAGAGVIGLAIGFGSQTLVRDVVSGGFFLIDDAFRIGEYVDVGKVKGTVEKIQLRSLRLRHHRGAVHTVPFGEIATLTNYSRDWVIMKLKFRVPFDTDIEKLRKLLKKVGKQLQENPDIADDFLQPFKSQGVLEVDDHGLIIRAKFMCKPGSQFLIRRHAYVAVQQAFADNDIEFARPQIRVARMGDDDDDNELVDAAAAARLLRDASPKPA